MTHITKVEFFDAFKTVFFASLGEDNVRGGFRGASLVPFNPEIVLLKLDIKLYTPSPSKLPPATPTP